MLAGNDIAVAVVFATAILLLMMGFMAILLVINSNRRHRHRAELAELDMQRQAELARAAREATEQTLSEVGRELHDNVGQLLTVAQMGVLDRLEAEAATDPRVAGTLEALSEGIEEVRRLGRTLNRDLWQRRGLTEAIETEAVRLEKLGRAKVHLTVEGPPEDPPPDERTILFRVFQEVLSNALRHSGAKTLVIRITGTPLFTLSVADDGKGFDIEKDGGGSGLTNIRARCALIGYRSELQTGPGQGCRWTFTPENTRDEKDSPGG